jgi:predicted metal-binding membrane protein
MRRVGLALTTAAGPPLLAMSAAAWAALLWAGASDTHGHLVSLRPEILPAPTWPLMVFAMMPPLVMDAIGHVWTRSLARRRWRQVLLFGAGYAIVWMTVGWLVASAAIHVGVIAGSALRAAVAVLVAACWQSTPAKQACLNRCHALPPLAAFGVAADRDVIRYGVTTGWWCVGSCWALMLAPLVIETAHGLLMGAAMAVTMAVALAERQVPCRPASWRLPFGGW